MIPVSRHEVVQADIDAVVDALRSDWITRGPRLEDFECEIARVAGARRAVCVGSGTAAVRAAVAAAGRDGLGVTSPLTFVATAHAITAAGLTPAVCDVKHDDLTLDVASFEHIVKVGVVVPVDFAGLSHDRAAVADFAHEADADIVVDACHSFGGYDDLLGYADSAAVSFHASKIVTTGEGGAVVTNSEAVASSVRARRDNARRDGVAQFDAGENLWMNELQAALGLSRLKRVRASLDARRRIARLYDAALASFGERIGVLAAQPNAGADGSARHLYVVRVLGEDGRREAFRAHLDSLGVATQVHYMPLWEHPAYASIQGRMACPNAARAAREIVSIPLWPGLSSSMIDEVIGAVESFDK